MATTRLRQLVQREPVFVAPEASIADAASRMAEKRVSALLICDNESLAGIVTDRDLRNRVVAARRAYQDPISTVMTPQPMTLDDRRRFGIEAALPQSEAIQQVSNI